MRKYLLLGFLAVMFTSSSLLAADPAKEPLWPEGAPGAKGTEEKDIPTITAYLPASEINTGCAVVVCPGGGYGHLATGHEGVEIGEFWNKQGVAAFVVEYRHSGRGYKHPAPLQDAQRAVRTVRARAEEYNLDPNRIGIMGFSAGGHLASSVGTHFDAGNPDAKDPVERVSSRPDFMILCYPVIAFDKPYTHKGSQRNLLGDDAPAELIEKMSSELQVTKDTPPTFLFHTTEDTGVPPQNSIVFYMALKEKGVPAEMHVFEKGRHGIGLGKNVPGSSAWPRLCVMWLKNQGMIPDKK
ncbi:alpha/beta hydrolase [Bremerella cremea]|uniref:Alpha/beta hydrolase n=1 Tax=Blastopirellula marina TaxID=124 RepID=A0A2S8FYJ3_9BACT|nr:MULTISPECIES: alpha/beta hydrolase [Pirellulaceae]PQO37252.1 alpha/beta hydrolase [Blastopirellula marina]RCS49639.1 alpha/beta hydrolase [Bremerella cremea]